MIEQLRDFIKANVPDHLRGRWASDIETQLNFTDPEKNTRIGSKTDGSRFIDLSDLEAIGPTGWNHVDQRTVYVVFDLDSIANHVAGLDNQTLDSLVAALVTLPEVEVIRSKSGHGYHVVIYFDPDRQPRSATRRDHIEVAKRVLSWLGSRLQLTIDLEAAVDACGVVAWIWHRNSGERGFEVIKRAGAFLPEEWETEFPNVPTGKCDLPEALPLTPKHQAIIDALTGRGKGEWKDGRLQTHTAHVAELADDPAMKITPGFVTIASGKGGPSDRNCWMVPAENGSWRVFRHGKGAKEHDSWWTSSGGWTTCYFNRQADKTEPTKVIVAIGERCELFHDADGRGYAVAKINGIRETIPVSDSRFRAYLRIAYRQKTGRIAAIKEITTAVAELEAVALQQRPEYAVAIRIAEHNGKLYIDLADRERRIVEVTAAGWRIVNDCPVRFVRPAGMLPLPLPLPGGTLADLRRFINIEDEDLPLLLAFVVSAFHPCGPYALLLLIGEQGAAKTSLMRLIAEMIDPNIEIGRAHV